MAKCYLCSNNYNHDNINVCSPEDIFCDECLNKPIMQAISDMGAKMCEFQQMGIGSGLNGVLRDYKCSKYDYKTNIPDFVDSIAMPKIHEAIKALEWDGDKVFFVDGIKYELIKWLKDDGVVVRINGEKERKINKKYFRQLYEKRDLAEKQ